MFLCSLRSPKHVPSFRLLVMKPFFFSFLFLHVINFSLFLTRRGQFFLCLPPMKTRNIKGHVYVATHMCLFGQILLQIGECVAIWWRPNFETIMYPYCPPHITKPKVQGLSSLDFPLAYYPCFSV